MEISLILAHPNPQSFNHAIARTCMETLQRTGHKVNFHDLYAEGYDPLLPTGEMARKAELPPLIELHCRELAGAEGIIIVHPNWWGQPPAILKGWLDRTLRPGVAYEFLEGDGGEGVPQGLLKAKAALVFNTSNTEAGREQRVFGDPLERIWRDCVFGLCGVANFQRRMFGIIITSTMAERRAWLAEVEEAALQYFPGPA